MRPAVPLPSLPLWLAATLALVADAAILAGLVIWTAAARIEAPAAPIEVSLVAASALEPAAAEPSETPPADVPQPSPPEPAEPPPPEPPPPVAPEPDAIQPPEPPKPPVPHRPPTPKPKPKPKPKPVQVAKPKPRPPAAPVVAAKPARVAPAPVSAGRGPATGHALARAPVSSGPVEGPTSPAAYLSNPAPGYPDSARRQRQQGTVQLRVLVSAQGQAVEVQLAQSSGVSGLDEAALRAVRRWRFAPARQRGQAITAWVRVPIRFSLSQ